MLFVACVRVDGLLVLDWFCLVVCVCWIVFVDLYACLRVRFGLVVWFGLGTLWFCGSVVFCGFVYLRFCFALWLRGAMVVVIPDLCLYLVWFWLFALLSFWVWFLVAWFGFCLTCLRFVLRFRYFSCWLGWFGLLAFMFAVFDFAAWVLVLAGWFVTVVRFGCGVTTTYVLRFVLVI